MSNIGLYNIIIYNAHSTYNYTTRLFLFIIIILQEINSRRKVPREGVFYSDLMNSRLKAQSGWREGRVCRVYAVYNIIQVLKSV